MNIRRNCNYIFIYKQRELSIVDRILSKHNIYNLNIDKLYDFYYNSTIDKGDCLLLDLTENPKYAIRHNFLQILYPINDKQHI